MPVLEQDNEPTRRYQAAGLLLVVVAAVVMGITTLRGGFVGADDNRLVLHHVLVNHPTLTHAVELFRIVHRDLYQPLPLLSFSAEFYIANTLGLFDASIAGGAWLFHGTNVLLHGANAALVWIVILGLCGSEDRRKGFAVATTAALLFAVHPLQAEVVAWLNGRMMLLSTLFALASVASTNVWLRDGRRRWAVATALFVLLSAISKIRVGLPLLLVLAVLANRPKRWRPVVGLMLVCAAITAVFAVINYQATAGAGMFEGAVKHLHGPRIVRALLALGWYFEHLIWPTGLASWYPTPGEVRWSDPATLRAALIVAAAMGVGLWAVLRSRRAAMGLAWFAFTIASTVQLVPTRNALAADRYMYLPIVGLLWVVAMALYTLYRRATHRWAGSRLIMGPAAAGATIAMVGLSWHTASFYETSAKKGRRIADLFPTTPHVWERVAWAYHNEGHQQRAIKCAWREFDHDDKSAQSAAYQVIGMAHLALGEPETAITSLELALDLKPGSSTAMYNLAKVFDELGRLDDALTYYERSVALAPLANPRIVRLAGLYRRLGRSEQARQMYERALQDTNNPFDVKAIMGLAELDIEAGTPNAYQSAEVRLKSLLSWMPENTDARVNLGVATHALGRVDEAARAYQDVLAREPKHLTATLNLAALYRQRGDNDRAGRLYEQAVAAGLDSVDQATIIHDFLIERQAPQQAVELWQTVASRLNDHVDVRLMLAWSRALAGDLDTARSRATAIDDAHQRNGLATATLAFVAVARKRYDIAAAQLDLLCAAGEEAARARARLRRALGRFVLQRPDDPWPYCLAAQLWIADGVVDNARVFIDLCEGQCEDASCRERVDDLRAKLTTSTGAVSRPGTDTP